MQTLTASTVGKWTLVAFTASMFAFNLWKADAWDVIVLGVAFLPWLVGPAAIAAYLAKRAPNGWVAWAFVVVEIAVAASTIALWSDLLLHPDAQNGIAMMFFPALQFAAVLVTGLLIKMAAVVFGTRSSSQI